MCNFVQLKFFGVQDFCPGSVTGKSDDPNRLVEYNESYDQSNYDR